MALLKEDLPKEKAFRRIRKKGMCLAQKCMNEAGAANALQAGSYPYAPTVFRTLTLIPGYAAKIVHPLDTRSSHAHVPRLANVCHS